MYFFVWEKLKSRHLFIVWSFNTQGGRCMYSVFMLIYIHTCQVHAAAPFPTYETSNFYNFSIYVRLRVTPKSNESQ